MSTTYGIDIKAEKDPFIGLAEYAMVGFDMGIALGTHLVVCFIASSFRPAVLMSCHYAGFAPLPQAHACLVSRCRFSTRRVEMEPRPQRSAQFAI